MVKSDYLTNICCITIFVITIVGKIGFKPVSLLSDKRMVKISLNKLFSLYSFFVIALTPILSSVVLVEEFVHLDWTALI